MTDPAQQKAQDDAATARIARLKAEVEFEEWNSASARAARAAARWSESSTATWKGVSDRATSAASLVPDLSTASNGKLTVNETPFAAALTQEALEQAAEEIVDALEVRGDPKAHCVVVTTDASLVGQYAVYRSIRNEIALLEAEVTRLEPVLSTFGTDADDSGVGTTSLDAGALIGVAGAAATQLISAFSVERAVSASSVAVTAELAQVAVLSHLGAARVRAAHDTFRMMDSESPLMEGVDKLTESRARAAKAAARLGVAPDGETPDEAKNRAAILGRVNELIAALTLFLKNATSVPEGAKHSNLSAAAFHDQLVRRHYTHIVLILTPTAEVTRVTSDGVIRKDKIDVVATISVPYLAIDTDGADYDAGLKEKPDTLFRSGMAKGVAGRRFTFDSDLAAQLRALR